MYAVPSWGAAVPSGLRIKLRRYGQNLQCGSKDPPLHGFALSGLTVKGRAELAGGEGVEGAEAGGEFGRGQAALAVEAAEKIVGGPFPFL